MTRLEYKLTDGDLQDLYEVCKPIPYLVVGGREPTRPEVRINRIWERLGRELGFDWRTVEPVDGKGNEYFTAIKIED